MTNEASPVLPVPPQHYVGVRAFRMELPTFLDRIEKKAASYIVVRHGKPVARIVPFAENVPSHVHPFPPPVAIRSPLKTRTLASRPKQKKQVKAKKGFTLGGLFRG